MGSEPPVLLLVDDDPGFLETAGVILSSKFTCRSAPSGEAALRSDLSSVDAVLLDIELGHGIDGFQTLEAMRARRPHLPIIMVSERDDPASIQKALDLGAVAFAPKPLDVAALEAHITAALSRPDSLPR